MPVSRYAPVDPQFSFFFGNVGHTCSLMQDVYEVSSVFFTAFEGNHRVWVVLRRDFQVSEKGDNEIAEMSEVPQCTPQSYGRSL